MQSIQAFKNEYGDDYNADYDKDLAEEEENDALNGWEVFEYTVPEWALPCLFNSDASGLDYSDNGDEDLQAIQHFLKTEKLDESKGHWSYDSENDEAYFSYDNDITNLGDNVVDIKWVQRIE